jgi:hypothetical protein
MKKNAKRYIILIAVLLGLIGATFLITKVASPKTDNTRSSTIDGLLDSIRNLSERLDNLESKSDDGSDYNAASESEVSNTEDSEESVESNTNNDSYLMKAFNLFLETGELEEGIDQRDFFVFMANNSASIRELYYRDPDKAISCLNSIFHNEWWGSNSKAYTESACKWICTRGTDEWDTVILGYISEYFENYIIEPSYCSSIISCIASYDASGAANIRNYILTDTNEGGYMTLDNCQEYIDLLNNVDIP